MTLLPIARDELVDGLLAQGAPVCFGVSGGKDSSAAALSTMRYLDQVGHQGPRLLIHSHLGRVEWEASLPMCKTLAQALGLELVVVQRGAGGQRQRSQGGRGREHGEEDEAGQGNNIGPEVSMGDSNVYRICFRSMSDILSTVCSSAVVTEFPVLP